MRRARASLLLVLGSALLAPAANAAQPTAPLSLLRQARTELRTTSGSGASAYRKLGAATARALWVSPSDAVAPPAGRAVFANSRIALLDLEPQLDSSAPPAIATVAGRLILLADRRLAEDAIREAVNGAGGLVARARGMVLSGDRWAATSRVDLAAEQYGRAWADAFDGLTPLAVTPAENVPATVLATAADNALAANRISFSTVRPIQNQPPLTKFGVPEVLLAAADGCAACELESWSLVEALSQFGVFSNLALSQSAVTRHPIVRGITFRGADYQSPYVSFGIAAASSSVPRPLPFVDVANKYADTGSPASPSIAGGLFWTKLAGSLSRPKTADGQAIDGTAELLTAEICEATDEAPAEVCGTAAVQGYQKRLPPASPVSQLTVTVTPASR
ncbi:MAG TPA: DUF929 family protein [Solirubrobacteraceae bacterium]|nr:DUF929 family protein [Solirubrobacteraceae bacterium]